MSIARFPSVVFRNVLAPGDRRHRLTSLTWQRRRKEPNCAIGQNTLDSSRVRQIGFLTKLQEECRGRIGRLHPVHGLGGRGINHQDCVRRPIGDFAKLLRCSPKSTPGPDHCHVRRVASGTVCRRAAVPGNAGGTGFGVDRIVPGLRQVDALVKLLLIQVRQNQRPPAVQRLAVRIDGTGGSPPIATRL